jgi:hypothetical protein
LVLCLIGFGASTYLTSQQAAQTTTEELEDPLILTINTASWILLIGAIVGLGLGSAMLIANYMRKRQMK